MPFCSRDYRWRFAHVFRVAHHKCRFAHVFKGLHLGLHVMAVLYSSSAVLQLGLYMRFGLPFYTSQVPFALGITSAVLHICLDFRVAILHIRSTDLYRDLSTLLCWDNNRKISFLVFNFGSVIKI